MNILFCGSYINPTITNKIEYCSEAGNNFQHNLIQELNKEHDIEVLSYIGYPTTKQQKELIKKTSCRTHVHFVMCCSLMDRVLNFFFYYYFFCKMIMRAEIVVLYNYHYIQCFIPVLGKILGKTTSVIVADYTEQTECQGWMRKLISCHTEKMYTQFSKVVFLSKNYFDRSKCKYKYFFPGAIKYSDYKGFVLKPINDRKIRVLYSGVFTTVTGVDLLLDSIAQIGDKNVEFVFSGRGDLLPQLENAVLQDNRIINKGFLTREEYYELLNSADILVNPRNMNMPQNKNNFPSKILEYLAAGRYIISTKFSGCECFEEYSVVYAKSESGDIAKKIRDAISSIEVKRKEIFEVNHIRAKEYDWENQIQNLIIFLQR